MIKTFIIAPDNCIIYYFSSLLKLFILIVSVQTSYYLEQYTDLLKSSRHYNGIFRQNYQNIDCFS